MVKKASISPGKARKENLIRRQREDIITAASAEFAAHGFNGAQIGAIAAAAEVSLTTLYSLFQSKEALYRKVIFEATTAVRDGVFDRVKKIDSPAEQLMAFIGGLLQSYEKNRDFMRLYVHVTQGFPYRIRPEMGSEALGIFESITAWLVSTAQEAIRQGEIDAELEAEAIAYTIMGSIVTTCSEWVERNEPRPLDEAAPQLRAVLGRILSTNSEQEAAPSPGRRRVRRKRD